MCVAGYTPKIDSTALFYMLVSRTYLYISRTAPT